MMTMMTMIMAMMMTMRINMTMIMVKMMITLQEMLFPNHPKGSVVGDLRSAIVDAGMMITMMIVDAGMMITILMIVLFWELR